MTFLKYKIRNNFITDTVVLDSLSNTSLSGVTSAITSTITGKSETLNNYKFIPLHIPLEFKPMDSGELIQNFIVEEREKAINKVYDAEKIKWTYPALNMSGTQFGLTVNFRFYNGTTFTSDYFNNGFDTSDFIPIIKNGFKKSFYRLYFYDSNMLETRNLILTEDINIGDPFNLQVGVTPIPTVTLEKIYWLRNDPMFDPISGNTMLPFRTFYTEARFFNAKTGKVIKFINLPLSQTTPIKISEQAYNPGWKTSPIMFINPKTNPYGIGNYQFFPQTNVGGNGTNSITFTEDIKI